MKCQVSPLTRVLVSTKQKMFRAIAQHTQHVCIIVACVLDSSSRFPPLVVFIEKLSDGFERVQGHVAFVVQRLFEFLVGSVENVHNPVSWKGARWATRMENETTWHDDSCIATSRYVLWWKSWISELCRKGKWYPEWSLTVAITATIIQSNAVVAWHRMMGKPPVIGKTFEMMFSTGWQYLQQRKTLVRPTITLIRCSLSCDSNWRCEFVMSLVNVLVEPFQVEQSVRVVEENFLKAHAEENINHQSREAWNFRGHVNSKNVSETNVQTACNRERNNLIHEHNFDNLRIISFNGISENTSSIPFEVFRWLRFRFC